MQESNPKHPTQKQPLSQRDQNFASDLRLIKKLAKLCRDFANNNIEAIGLKAQSLCWNNKEPMLIRNRFGRINYAQGGKQNTQFIDFECLSHLLRLAQDPNFKNSLMPLFDNDTIRGGICRSSQ